VLILFVSFSFSKKLKLICFSLIFIIFALSVFPRKSVSVSVEETSGIPVPILMYHSVCENTKIHSDYLITPEVFENDVKYLHENGYTAIFVSDLIEYVHNQKELPDKPVIITLDDGFLNNLTFVLPLLEKYDMKAAVSVVGSYVETFSNNTDKNPDYAYLTWKDIKTLDDSGRIEIGNHTYNMHDLKKRNGCMKKLSETDEEYTKILTENLTKLQLALQEKTGIVPDFFAYPFGAISKESVPIIKSLGFKAALTCSEGINYITKDTDLYKLKRFNRPSGSKTEDFMKKILS